LATKLACGAVKTNGHLGTLRHPFEDLENLKDYSHESWVQSLSFADDVDHDDTDERDCRLLSHLLNCTIAEPDRLIRGKGSLSSVAPDPQRKTVVFRWIFLSDKGSAFKSNRYV
jgi:hypothetical protein